jgi:hypothetical protein
MTSVFASLDRAILVEDPFPHLVVEDALPAEIARTLLAEMPPLEVLTQGRPPGSNARFYLPSSIALEDPRISPAWKQANRACVEAMGDVLTCVVRRLGAELHTAYPDFERRFGPLDGLRPRSRYEPGRRPHEVGVDAQIVVNSPALTDGTRVRGPHLDVSDKLFSGLLYLRPRDDDSKGAELELYAPAMEPLTFDVENAAPAHAVVHVRTYPYRHNLLVLPLNTPRALHGVSPRGRTPHPRYHFHLVGEMSEPLFTVRRSHDAATAGIVPGPSRRRLDLGELLLQGDAVVRADGASGAVILVTGPRQWSYGGLLSIDPDGAFQGRAILKVALSVSEGWLGVGVLRKHSSTEFLVPEQSVKAGERGDLTFALPDVREAGHLVLRGWVAGATTARLAGIALHDAVS